MLECLAQILSKVYVLHCNSDFGEDFTSSKKLTAAEFVDHGLLDVTCSDDARGAGLDSPGSDWRSGESVKGGMVATIMGDILASVTSSAPVARRSRSARRDLPVPRTLSPFRVRDGVMLGPWTLHMLGVSLMQSTPALMHRVQGR